MGFYDTILPYAQKASSVLGIPVSVIMGQWANESARGTSALAKATGNLGGIKYTPNAPASWQGYANYNGDYGKFTDDYIRVLKLSYYKGVRDAGTVEDTIKALSLAPYAESGYNGGKSILDVIKADGLTKYDTLSPVSTPAVGSIYKNSDGTFKLVFFGAIAVIALLFAL